MDLHDRRRIEEALALGRRVALRLADLGETPAAVAARIPGFNVTSLQRLLHPETPQNPTLGTLVALADAFHVALHVLLGSQDAASGAPLAAPETLELIRLLSLLPHHERGALVAAVRAYVMARHRNTAPADGPGRPAHPADTPVSPPPTGPQDCQ